MNIPMPILIDDLDDQVDEAYAALPTRIFLVDAEGRIAYRGEPGPWGFKPDELEAAIREQLQVPV